MYLCGLDVGRSHLSRVGPASYNARGVSGEAGAVARKVFSKVSAASGRAGIVGEAG